MHMEERTIAQRIAGDLLISQERSWDLHEARRITIRALRVLGQSPSGPCFRSLVHATFQLGRAIDQVTDFEAAVPWKIEPIQVRLYNAIREWFPMEERHAFVCGLASHIKNKEPFRPRIADWTPELNRFLRQTCTPDRFPDVMAKISVAQLADQLIEERRSALIAYAEQELEIRLETVAEALREASAAAHARRQARRETLSERPSGRKTRDARTNMAETHLDQLCAIAHPSLRTEFAEWLQRLAPLAREAACRRLSMLASEPLVHRLWVKPIVLSTDARLRELRIVAQHLHYRVLFLGEPHQVPLVLSFGLRRDLADLVRGACRLI